ncbi:telomerase protein component 1 [Trichonephila clavipes]|nr:telomerase protein component 1 [Trichonephila clavipes]
MLARVGSVSERQWLTEDHSSYYQSSCYSTGFVVINYPPCDQYTWVQHDPSETTTRAEFTLATTVNPPTLTPVHRAVVPGLTTFIAERSSGGQLAYVENIDAKYDLTKITNTDKYKNLKTSLVSEHLPKVPLLTRVPKWHTVRIFISSTFKDMHSERDMLIRFVMPELKKRAASIFVKINEVDLRWGISESDCASKRYFFAFDVYIC